MGKKIKWLVAGGSVLGISAAMTAIATAAPGSVPTASIQLSAAGSQGGISGANQAAVTYVDASYPGSGTATVLATSPDVEHGVSVYDIRIVAPNGSTYVVHVQQSNDSVLSANLAELQVNNPPVTTAPPATTPVTTAPPATTPVTTAPPATTPVTTAPPATTPVTTTPVTTEPVQTPEVPVTEPVQTTETTQPQSTSGSSVDVQENPGATSTTSTTVSPDHQGNSSDKNKSTTKSTTKSSDN